MKDNLRHLRVFLAVAETASITRAAELSFVSQPAVTQAIGKLEQRAGTPLFRRTRTGVHPTAAGEALAARARRAFALLDPALADLAPRLRLTASTAQLRALIAMREMENFTLAARRLGLAQPTVHRAVTQLEQEAGRALFERTAHGMIATRLAETLARAARLAFAELDQAEADVAETIRDESGREVGRIVIGAMPLSRSSLLPATIARFRRLRPRLPILVRDGAYDDLLAGLRRGEIDMLVGALREPAPIADVEQRPLFDDTLVLVAGLGHPLAQRKTVGIGDLGGYPWVVARSGTPARRHFDRLFEGAEAPASIVESGSLILMRELLAMSDHLGCLSLAQARVESERGLLRILPCAMRDATRRIGLTLRCDWLPTRAQREFLDLMSETAARAED